MISIDELYMLSPGLLSRDFCFIENTVQANLLAATAENDEAANQVYNIAFGERTTLNDLFRLIKERVVAEAPQAREIEPTYRDFRAGDVMHSLADIAKAEHLLGYAPEFSIQTGLDKAVKWYLQNLQQ